MDLIKSIPLFPSLYLRLSTLSSPEPYLINPLRVIWRLIPQKKVGSLADPSSKPESARLPLVHLAIYLVNDCSTLALPCVCVYVYCLVCQLYFGIHWTHSYPIMWRGTCPSNQVFNDYLSQTYRHTLTKILAPKLYKYMTYRAE